MGSLHYLTAAVPWRGQGIAQSPAEDCLAKLSSLGIRKCNIFLFADNRQGEIFWTRAGWTERRGLNLLERTFL